MTTFVLHDTTAQALVPYLIALTMRIDYITSRHLTDACPRVPVTPIHAACTIARQTLLDMVRDTLAYTKVKRLRRTTFLLYAAKASAIICVPEKPTGFTKNFSINTVLKINTLTKILVPYLIDALLFSTSYDAVTIRCIPFVSH
jgi:hypothetical protein